MNKNSDINNWIKYRIKPEAVYNFLFKKDIPIHKYSFWYYWGFFTLFCLTIQIISGVLLLFYYKPSIEDAHASIVYITNNVPFGSFIRSVHSWNANLLILSAAVHMFSVFFMKSYRKPREILWMSGVFIFILLLGFGFTGYILPWDEFSYFGTQVGLAEMEKFPVLGPLVSDFLKGGKHIGTATLTRMFAVHTGLLPLLLTVFLGLHLVLNRVNEYSLPLNINENVTGKHYKDFYYRAFIGCLILLAILVTFAVLIPKDMGKAFDLNNLTETPEVIHPDWYFMFLYQTLKLESLIPPAVTVTLISLITIFWFLVPVFDKNASKGKKSLLFTATGIIILGYVIIMTIWAYIGVSVI